MNDTKPNNRSSQVNFVRALRNLERSLASPILELRDASGIIKDFEMTYELSWKVLKSLLLEAGHQTLGAKDVYTRAFQLGYISDELTWLNMIQDRNQSSHVYDQESANRIITNIKASYLKAFQSLETQIADK